MFMGQRQIGIGRVQVNATVANNVGASLVNAEGAGKLKGVIESCPQVEFILQRNEETRPLWSALEAAGPLPPNVSFLFDESKGTGVVAASWPTPLAAPFGYAGGLGPKTLALQLGKMMDTVEASAASVAVPSLWVDMESSLRTVLGPKDGETDTFDVNKCMACVLIAEAAAAEGRIALVSA
jgi:hypothetical protein